MVGRRRREKGFVILYEGGRGFIAARVEEIGGKVYVYDRWNRRVGWVAQNGTFDALNRKIAKARDINILIDRAKNSRRR